MYMAILLLESLNADHHSDNKNNPMNIKSDTNPQKW